MAWRLFLLVASAASYMLPTDVAPRHYDLRAVYDVDPGTNFSFYAVVDIKIIVKNPVTKIVLHAEDFTINNNDIKLEGPGDLKVTGVNLDASLNLLTLTLSGNLQQDKEYTLKIPFSGNAKIGLEGAYISKYFDQSSQKDEYLLTTQFQATAARKAFPCFDEPQYKATFSVVIGHHRDFGSISNMPLQNSTTNNILEPYWPWTEIEKTFKKQQSQFVFDRFENSLPMSTYLVAYVISKFTYVESHPNASNTTFRIWARKDSISQTAYAASIGPRILSFYEDFFNVSFPLPKQDMIAIPDFGAGAMENWGLITYQEISLLYDPKQSAYKNKEYIAQVIAHELAHQWFGNLVTMKWWSDLWLNEGFATFMESLSVTALEPKWHVDELYAVGHTETVMHLDVLKSSHAIRMNLEGPRQIGEIFDTVSYEKGAVVIRMMYIFLGETVFREALHNYLTKYSYKNAEQDDLWQELTEVAEKYDGLAQNISIKTVMDTWTTQTGFPLLNVVRTCAEYGHCTLTVSQKRYLNWGVNDTSHSAWWVPLTMTWSGKHRQVDKPMYWLAADRDEHQFPFNIMQEEWFMLNPNIIAPCRINYDQSNWGLLTTVLMSGNMSSIPMMGRQQLLSDAFTLAWNNQLEYSIPLQLTKYLKRETEYVPLQTAKSHLMRIDEALKFTADYGVYRDFVKTFITDLYRRYGFKKTVKEDDLKSVRLQKLTCSWACRVGVPSCEDDAVKLYRRWMNEKIPDTHNPIPRNLLFSVSCVAIEFGNEDHWLFAVERLKRSNVPDTRQALLLALSCTREVWLLKQYLEWTIQPSSWIRRQDAIDAIVGVATSSIGFYVAKDFLYSRMKDIDKELGDQGDRLGTIFKDLLEQFTTQRDLDEFLKWYEVHKVYLQDATLSIKQGIEMARVNIDWMTRNRKLVVDQMKDLTQDSGKDVKNMYLRQRQGEMSGTPPMTASFYCSCVFVILLNIVEFL